jgi:ribokinase
MNEIVVIGSINADLVFVSKKRPKAGETLIGEEFLTIPGGKGANQAVAAAKLGAKVAMIGCVGNDIYGKKMIENFNINGVDASRIKELSISTGVAGIMVDNEDNSIVVIPGANQRVDCNLIDEHIDTILGSKIVVLQLEIPMETVEYVINICSKHNIQTILNPAPASKLSENIIEKVTYITPNEHEAVEIFGESNIERLLERYPNKLIVTQGEKGVIFNDGYQTRTVPSNKVKVVDTTGAGDTFNGAFAICKIENKSLIEAVKYANKAAAISITKYGAQGGMPSKAEVERWK